MDKKLRDKVKSLDPVFKRKVEHMFRTMSDSIHFLYDMVTHDEKTGLYNYKFFDNLLSIEIEKAKRGQDVCVAMIDLDFFKQINNKYGHIKGDELLIRFAGLLQKHVRKYDIVARFGGEEFVILLPRTSIGKARKMSKRLRELMNSDKTLKRYKITMSGGVSQFKRGDTKPKLMKRVNKALFQAKEKGRDNFVVVK